MSKLLFTISLWKWSPLKKCIFFNNLPIYPITITKKMCQYSGKFALNLLKKLYRSLDEVTNKWKQVWCVNFVASIDIIKLTAVLGWICGTQGRKVNALDQMAPIGSTKSKDMMVISMKFIKDSLKFKISKSSGHHGAYAGARLPDMGSQAKKLLTSTSSTSLGLGISILDWQIHTLQLK